MKFKFRDIFRLEPSLETNEVYEEELETRIAVGKERRSEIDGLLEQNKAQRKIPERIVATTRFKIPESFKLSNPYKDLPLDVVDDENEVRFKTAISLLGLNISSSKEGLSSYYEIEQPAQAKALKGYLVRIRQQEIGGKKVTTFAVKGPKQTVEGVMKSRVEAEAFINRPAELFNFLTAAGLTEGDYRETKRTTYKSENGKITIELDEFPDSRVPYSLEFEGKDPAEILAEANKFTKLGSPNSIGGTKFLKQYVSKDQIKDMRFNKDKRHFFKPGKPYSS